MRHTRERRRGSCYSRSEGTAPSRSVVRAVLGALGRSGSSSCSTGRSRGTGRQGTSRSQRHRSRRSRGPWSQSTPSSPARASSRLVATRERRGWAHGCGCQGSTRGCRELGLIALRLPPRGPSFLRGHKRPPASSRPTATDAPSGERSSRRDALGPAIAAAKPARAPKVPCALDHRQRAVALPCADAGGACSAFPPPLAAARAAARAGVALAQVFCLRAGHSAASAAAQPASEAMERTCALENRERPEHLARDDRGEIQCARHHAASQRARYRCGSALHARATVSESEARARSTVVSGLLGRPLRSCSSVHVTHAA